MLVFDPAVLATEEKETSMPRTLTGRPTVDVCFKFHCVERGMQHLAPNWSHIRQSFCEAVPRLINI